MNSPTKVGWWWYATAWTNLTVGAYIGHLTPFITGLFFLVLSVAMLWEGSES